MASTHYHLRYCMPFVRLVCGDTGLPVLMALISHANTRNRAYPSYEGLMLVTGLSRASISKAIQGLIDLDMVRIIDNSERSEEERNLDSRLNVYELSGYMKIGNLVIAYQAIDNGKYKYKPTKLEDFEYEELLSDIAVYKFTTYTDMVHHVDAKKVYHLVNTPEKKKEKELSLPKTATTVATSLPTTPNAKPKKTRTPKTTEPLIVNLTNEQLKRERPADMDESEYQHWLGVKPAWELMAIWVTWNLKKGAYQGWEHYLNHAVKMEQDRIYRNIQDMGKWLHTLAKEAGFALTYEWLKGFDQWYLDEIVCGLDEVKYPTKRETFYKNFSLYVNYLHQQQENDHE